jgi:glucosylceramidase
VITIRTTRIRLIAVAVAATVIGATAAGPVAHGAGDEVTVDVVASSEDGSARVDVQQRTVVPGPGSGPQVQIDLAGARQRLHGVGAALTESSAYLMSELPDAERRALLEELFDPERGGHSVLRVPIGASDFVLETVSLADSPVPDPELTTFTIERDRRWVIPVLREILAINPDIEILASPWSAPGWMKNTGSYINGLLLEEFEGVFADYLVRFLEAYRDEGIAVDWLTVQNEPAAIFLDTPSMVMPSDQQVRVIRDHLGPALVRAGLDTRVLAWDHNWCDARPNASPPGSCVGTDPSPFPLEVLQGTGGAYPQAGTGFHCYGGDQAAANELVHDARPDLQIWQTECSGGAWQSDPFGDLARLLITDRNHWSNATILWNLALDPDNGPTTGCGTCRGVVTIDPATDTWTPEIERDLLATMGWFGGKDSGVLATTATDGLLATGVCSPDQRPAAIVWNPSDAPVTATVSYDDLALPIELASRSLTAVRAPEGVDCELAAWPALPPPPPAPPTTPTTTPPATAPAAVPASPVAASPRYTG